VGILHRWLPKARAPGPAIGGNVAPLAAQSTGSRPGRRWERCTIDYLVRQLLVDLPSPGFMEHS